MLRLRKKASFYIRENGTASLTVNSAQTPKVALASLNRPAKLKPSRLVHCLRKKNLRTNTFYLGFAKYKLAECTNRRCALRRIDSCGIYMTSFLITQNHSIYGSL